LYVFCCLVDASLHDPQPVACILPVAVALHDGSLAVGERNHVGAVGETPRGPGSGSHRAAERAFDQLSLGVLRLHKPEATGDHCRLAATAGAGKHRRRVLYRVRP
jgi:hypothetical protein